MKKMIFIFTAAVLAISAFTLSKLVQHRTDLVEATETTKYTIEDIKNLQDFLLVRKTPDLSESGVRKFADRSDTQVKAKNILITICILIFLTGLTGSLWLIFKSHSQTVQIIQDGTVLYTINLEKSEYQKIEVEYQGSKNVIRINNHKISVIDAECPDQTCVKMGELKSSAAPIVCLPNKLVVKFAETDDIDAEVK